MGDAFDQVIVSDFVAELVFFFGVGLPPGLNFSPDFGDLREVLWREWRVLDEVSDGDLLYCRGRLFRETVVKDVQIDHHILFDLLCFRFVELFDDLDLHLFALLCFLHLVYCALVLPQVALHHLTTQQLHSRTVIVYHEQPGLNAISRKHLVLTQLLLLLVSVDHLTIAPIEGRSIVHHNLFVSKGTPNFVAIDVDLDSISSIGLGDQHVCLIQSEEGSVLEAEGGSVGAISAFHIDDDVGSDHFDAPIATGHEGQSCLLDANFAIDGLILGSFVKLDPFL